MGLQTSSYHSGTAGHGGVLGGLPGGNPPHWGSGNIGQFPTTTANDNVGVKSVTSFARESSDLNQIDQRIAELKEFGREEGTIYSAESEDGLRKFLQLYQPVCRPNVFLLPNGNFRAVWKDKGGDQLGLQFRGQAVVQFAAFARSKDETLTSSGRVTLRGIRKLVSGLGLERLVFA